MTWRRLACAHAPSRRRLRCSAVGIALAVLTASCGAAPDVVVPIAGPAASRERASPDDVFSTSTESRDPVERATTELVPDPLTVEDDDAVIVPATTTTSPATSIPTTTSTTTSTTTTTTSSTTSSTTTLPPLATAPLPPAPTRAPANPWFTASNTAFDRLAEANAAASMTVVRSGEIIFTRAAGRTVDDQQATGDSPMVVASVSKVIVAVAIARLHAQGLIDVAAPVPWAALGLATHPAWGDVTVRELLDHRSGLVTARSSWFTGEGTCRDHVPSLLASPPRAHRGTWVYSNANYCLLGLLLEERTDLELDAALQALVFDPVAAQGVHLTHGGLQPGDTPHSHDVARLSRLGGAGSLLVSTDDIALAIGRLGASDRAILTPPAVFTDQYGWGHTGTIDGAKACVWMLDDGDTVVSATIAGNSVSTGGAVCDLVVPAIATDLGIDAGRPVRRP